MKKFLCFLAVLFVLTITVGCSSMETPDILTQEPPNYSVSAEVTAESQDNMSSDANAQIDLADLPPEGTDCLAVANEYALTFQSLFLKYLQFEEKELSIKVSNDHSLYVNIEGLAFYPVIDDEIKCYDDLKNILMEYCTDEFAQKLLNKAVYRDINNTLYKADNGLCPASKSQFGCYIDDCVLDGNKMTVNIIDIGSENENFDIDLERYEFMMLHDRLIEMTLVWENEKWFISDITSGYESCIGYAYREDITKSMHSEVTAESQDNMSSDANAQTDLADLPPEETDCLAVANEYALTFQSLFLKYLQYEEKELSIKVSNDHSLYVNIEGLAFYPVIDDEIKCYDDLKNILMEYCTDEFAQKLLNDAHYRNYDNALYKGICELAPAAKEQFGCYISDCALDGNEIIVNFINIGAYNENFEIDLERYCRMMNHDQPFEMTLVWENEHWLISDISGYESCIGYAYREDITKSMHSEVTAESQDNMSSDENAQIDLADLPPEGTDCLAVANEYALTFQSLFLKYLQYEENELSIKLNLDYDFAINEDGFLYLPVVDDKIKSYHDLKSVFTDYCTDEFAKKLLDDALYRNYDNALYKGICELAPAAKYQYGCYISDCALDGNEIIVNFINIGADNENFEIDLERYCRMMNHDQPFEMTLVWENERWLISDISGYESCIGYAYREDITKSMHEAN